MSTLERAIEIAAKAHAGAVDKGGAPYILHPLRVMLAQDTDQARIVAVLHDGVEDCDVTVEQLRAEGFSEVVLDGILSVTKRPAEAYPDFVARAGANRLGRVVKLADLVDNSDLSRLPAPTSRDMERMEKYRDAIAQLRALAD
jgi:(p)ppGpp synthase/HD superfamily hydrolase